MAISVRRSLVWAGISQAGMFTFVFGGSLVLARLLTPYEMGIFAVAMAVVGALTIVRGFGFGAYLVRAPVLTEPLLATLFTLNGALAVVLSAAVVVAAEFGGQFLGDRGVTRVLLLVSVIPILNSLEFLPNCGMERAGRFGTLGVINLIRAGLGSTLTVGLAFAGFSYMSMAWGQVLGTCVGVVLSNIAGRRHARLRFGLENWRAVTSFGSDIFIITSLNLLTQRLSEVALGRILGLDALGLYSRASGLNSMLWENLNQIVARVVFVDFSEQKRNGRSLRYSYLRVLEVMTGLLWPAFAGMAVISGPLILMLYGPAWTGAALALSLLSLSGLALVSITMTWEVFVVSERTRLQVRYEAARSGLGFLLFVAGCVAGLAWAAAARVAEALFAALLYRSEMERMTDSSLGDFLPIYARSAGLTLVAVAPATAVMAAHGWAVTTPLPLVLGAVAGGMVLWAATLLWMGHPIAAEGRRMVAKVFPRFA